MFLVDLEDVWFGVSEVAETAEQQNKADEVVLSFAE